MLRKLQWIGLVTAGVLVFLSFLGRRDIVTSHEARVAQTAREMAEAGWPWDAKRVRVPGVELTETPGGLRLAAQRDKAPLEVNPWGVPVMNGQIRLQKPPLPYWVAAVTYRVTGVCEGAARLGPAVLGVLCIPLLYDLARRLIGRRAAWVAALLWVSSYFMVDEFRKSMADPYLAFFTLLCLWAWVRAAGHTGGARVGQDGLIEGQMGGVGSAKPPACGEMIRRYEGCCGALLVFYGGIGLGVLAKGPVLLIHLAIAIAAFQICYRAGLPRGWKGHLAGVGLLLAIAAPWPVYVMEHVPNALVLWRYESVGELTGENVEKAREWFFYLPNLAQLSLPWVAMWVGALVYPFVRKGRHRRRFLFPLLWYGGTVLFFSLSAVKKNAYLLPMMPAQVLLMAQGVVGLMAMSRRKGKWPGITVEVQKIIGVAWGLAVAGMLLLNLVNWPWGEVRMGAIAGLVKQSMGQVSGAAVGMAALALIAGGLPLVFDSRRQIRRWFAAQAAGYAVLLTLSSVGWSIPWDNARSPKDLAQHAAIAAKQPGYTISRARLQEAAMFYLPNDLEYDASAQRVLVIVEKRPKYRINTEDVKYFEADVPEGRPAAAKEVPVGVTSARDCWRLYEVRVEK